MYCHNCGQEQSERHKFCENCGAELNAASQSQHPGSDDKSTGSGAGKKFGKGFVIVLVAFAIFGFLFALCSFDSDPDEETISAEAEETIPTETAVVQTESDPLIPENGWYTEDGKQYYFQDGAMCVDIHEIDNEYYYFHEDGTLAVNDDVDYDGWIFKTDHDGVIVRVIFDMIGGEWSEEKYRFGNSGTSSILELAIPVEDCTSMSFYLNAHGERGAKVNGKWKIYVRSNGKWKFVETIDYKEPDGSFDIEFDEPMAFDAITAYPTVQGNASYSAYFYPENVDCSFQVLKNIL